MKRRELIRQLALVSLAAGAGSAGLPMQAMAATCSNYPTLQRTLVNVMLLGGCDTRFIIMPAFAEDKGIGDGHLDLFWQARRDMYPGLPDPNNAGSFIPYSSYEQMFRNEYLLVPEDTPGAPHAFGIHKSCGWLHQQFIAGNVAIVANAVCSSNRRHDQSILNADAGVPGYTELNQDRDGWGGRLMEQITLSGANAVEIGSSISVYNKGSDPGNRLSKVIHAADARNLAMPATADGFDTREGRVLTRALNAYYKGRAQEVAAEKSAEWPFQRFFKHDASFRELGGDMAAALDDCGAIPASLQFNGAPLNSGSWAAQCRNLHDVCLTADILGLRSISMSYGGWDTHGNEHFRIGRNLSDIFGTDRGLHRVMMELEDNTASNAPEELVFYFATDFGRQLVCNGDLGTDHGKGLYSVLLGEQVKGGVYGTMFPVSETQEVDGAIPLQRHGADIAGLTSTEHILAEICNWMQPDSANLVVLGHGSSILEGGAYLDLLPT